MSRFARLMAIATVFLLAQAHAAWAQSPREDDLIGLWAYRTEFPTGLEGQLTLTRSGNEWRGSIGDATATAQASQSHFRLVFPDEGGTFRGYLDAKGRLERGFWTRREVLDDLRYPEGAAQGYAMPLVLRAQGNGRWLATVTPLPDPFTLYLNVFRDGGGALKAAIRNPEHHRHGPAMQLYATLERQQLRLGAKPEPGEGDLLATVSPDAQRIDLRWNDLRRTLPMTRATPAQTALFTARPRDEARYVYRQPRDLGDGWRTARAASLGVDEAALARAVQRIIDIDPSSERAWLIHSMAIAYKGRLILDEYFYGNGPDIPHDMRSASKTFSSVTLGAAMRDGAKISPQSRLYEIVAPMGPFAFADPRKQRITLAHVMTHTTGLACDDNTEGAPGGEDDMQTQRAQPNWWKYTLDLPILHEPGERYAYCSGGISLTGAALTYSTGEWLPALFDRTVAKPLQFGTYYWNVMPTGEGYLGGGAFVRTRDFLKLGQAYLDDGVWNGRRIVSEAWVKDSIAPHVRISPATTGRSGDDFASVYYDMPEGFAWHHINVKSGDKVYPAYHGNGNGGQLLLVVPQFDLAVMFTAGNYRQGLWNRERDDIVGAMIIPALAGAAPAAQAGP